MQFKTFLFTISYVFFCTAFVVYPAFCEEIVIYDFEEDAQEWQIPDWAKGNEDYVGSDLTLSKEHSSALRVFADFPGTGVWKGVYIERVMDVTDWSDFASIKADIFLPEDAPEGVGGRFIFTLGDDWVWTEMNRPLSLKPGEWTTISASILPDSMDWRYFLTDEFRKDIRKIGIRIETITHTAAYSGPLYIDNIRVCSERED
ncbi:MAG: hypothetical protein JW844_04470 [Candidatus Omnitrophica bacterium]|nr:hypothetical protein [Candidatus Omnitrophota bacterium]